MGKKHTLQRKSDEYKTGERELVGLIEGEAKRASLLEKLQPNPTLTAEGWERRFVADTRRAQEALELYNQLGLEVRVEPVSSYELPDECADCQLVAHLQFKTIYTRKPLIE